MNLDWQNFTALIAVAAAAAYLTRAAWRTIARRKSGGCGSCGSCPSGGEAKQPELFGIGLAPVAEKLSSNGKTHSQASGR